jgi:hypothetical protein
MPFPGTRVVHRDFERHHRPIAEGTMTVGVVVTRAGTGPGTFDPDTGSNTGAARVDVAATEARIQPTAAAARQTVAGDQVVTLRTYLVALPWNVAGVLVDDRVEVTSVAEADSDPDLLGTLLRVRDVTKTSTQWQRTLVCEEDLG